MSINNTTSRDGENFFLGNKKASLKSIESELEFSIRLHGEIIDTSIYVGRDYARLDVNLQVSDMEKDYEFSIGGKHLVTDFMDHMGAVTTDNLIGKPVEVLIHKPDEIYALRRERR